MDKYEGSKLFIPFKRNYLPDWPVEPYVVTKEDMEEVIKQFKEHPEYFKLDRQRWLS